MRIILIISFLLTAPSAHAAVACIDKATGSVIEYQSFGSPGICHKNLVEDNPQYGYAADDIEQVDLADPLDDVETLTLTDGKLVRDAKKVEEREKRQQKETDIPVKDLGSSAVVAALTALGITSIRGTKKAEKKTT